jgi:predicted RNA-binding Zn ribbon-like protein
VTARQDAPGPLGLVEAFLRTRNEVTDAPAMRRWFTAHDLTSRDPTPHDPTAHDLTTTAPVTYERAVRLREALRSLMLANNGGTADPDAVATVNAEITACGLRPQLADDASHLRWSAADGTLGVILTAVVAAMADGTWPRMKACAADDCRYAFYDHTRNRSGRWCDVSGCGANARMRAYRRRRDGHT